MARKTRTARTTVTEFEEQELSIRALSLRPEVFQSRARLDKRWSNQYSKDMAKGDAFPPILVYRLPDGTMVVVDGFHRIDAAEAIGKKSIRCQIRNGTEQDALLAAIEANMADFHRGRPFQEEDKQRSVELMIRHGAGYPGTGTWDWPNQEIARRCCVGAKLVGTARVRLSEESGIPIPKTIKKFSGGKWTGTYFPYKFGRVSPSVKEPASRPRMTPYKGRFQASIGNQTVVLGKSKDEAEERLDQILSDRSVTLKTLASSFDLWSWLTARSVLVETIPKGKCVVGGLKARGAFLFPVSCMDAQAILKAIGHASILRKAYSEHAARTVLVVLDRPRRPQGSGVAALAMLEPNPIEFMTPEEVVAEFGPKEEA